MRKNILLIVLLQVCVVLGYAQEKISTQSQIIVTPMGKPTDPCPTCPVSYQWNRDTDGDGFGNPSQSTFSDTQPPGYVANQADLNDNDFYITDITPHTVYRDADGDTFGTSATTALASNSRPGYVSNAADCNDADASINPNTVWYRDADADGYGTSSLTAISCTQPGGYVRNAADYNDGTANITNIAPQYFYYDADGDGFGNPSIYIYYSSGLAGYVTNGSDCNDGDGSINPNTVWYRDADGDGFGNGAVPTYSCSQPGGYVRNAGDYNDGTGNITDMPPQYFYQDADGDWYGNPSVYVYYSYQPPGFVTNGADCNDGNASINPNTIWYRDADGDGYGNNSLTTLSCTQPSGYVSNNADCIDYEASLNPNTVWYRDADGDGYGNGAIATVSCNTPMGFVMNAMDYDDSTANINYIAPHYFYQDYDGDGYGNPSVYVYYSYQPNRYVTNESDCNDGDGSVNPNTVWYHDADGDGFGNGGITANSCNQPGGYVRNAADCNDGDGSINPNTVWYLDADGDTFGNGNVTIVSCNKPQGYVRTASDYNDDTANITNIPPQYFYHDNDGDGFGNPSVYVYYSYQPSGFVLNGADCNDGDSSLNPNTVWYHDADNDGYGNAGEPAYSCIQPGGYVRNAGDYNDGTSTITNIPPQYFYYDSDGDGFGNPAQGIYYSNMPSGYVTNNADCNDSDVSINPNTVWYLDTDGDTFGNGNVIIVSCNQPQGYVRTASDYNDDTANITNIAPQYFYNDADGDGFGNQYVSVYYSNKPSGYVNNNADCNDGDSSLNPNSVWYLDADGDTFGNINVTSVSCTQPLGYVRNAADYNDGTANITNIAPQYFYQDADGDGFGNSSVSVYYSNLPIGYVSNTSDCNDGDAAINPNTRWYADNDLDGLGEPSNYVQQCTAPAGNYVRDNTDNCPLVSGTSPDCSNIVSPSADHNYIITKTYKEPTASALVSPTANQVQTNITYFDGLGRPMQQIANRQSSSGKDIITHIGYDDFGRQFQEYLPYAGTSTNMAFESSAAENTISFYNTEKYENTSNPFSQKQLESSPLSRVLKQAAPGTPWQMGSGHEIKLDYQTNTASEVKLYQATATWNAGSGLYDISFSDSGNYAANELYKNVTYDENTTANPAESSGSTVEFKNKEGQVVLKRTYDAGDKHDTYYVYDDYGNLTYVIPPKAEGAINTDVLNDLCYQYKYDYRNRLAEKKLPGKQWEFIVYDKLDRPVATGPALSPFKDDTASGWLITKYDAFSRPIYTGWSSQASNASTRNSLQTAQNAALVLFETKQTSGTIDGFAVYYSNAVEPTSFKLLTVSYYDDYAFPSAQTAPSAIEGQTVLVNAKSLATGNWARALTTASSTAGEITTTFYDAKARPVRTYTQNYLGGYTYTDSKLDFTGKALYTIAKHKRTAGDAELTIKEEFTYSPQDRLLTHTHQINGGAVELMASNTYDELGQLTSKNVGNSTGSPLQKVDFNYNIRGWLTEINKTANLQQGSDPTDLFAFKINYNAPQAGIAGVSSLYNGNIAEILWKTGSDATDRGYGYKYDNLNRLKNAVYEKSGLTTNAYDENLTYDKNGNILSLTRKGDIDPQAGTIEIDNLAYTYPPNSNQLSKVTDNANNTSGFNDFNKTGDDYTYDENGNMITDKNKNITAITYNQLNLPKKITFGTTGSIEYIYSAAGEKLEKIVTDGPVTDNTNYLDGFQYKNNTLEFFSTAEGYVKNISGALSYVFQYKDHLGNIRVSYAKNPQTQVLEIIEENNYYPFGLKHKGYNDYLATGNKYKFLGQERQDELGLNWDTFRHRNYDYAIGRFFGVDPVSEEYMSISPYQFAHNNPVWKIELEGLEGQVTTNQDIVNREPVYMTTNIIINTTNIQSAKPQNSRPGVPMLRMGIGVDKSYKKEFGSENDGATATATAAKANVGIAVCVDGERVEYGLTVGQVSADGKVGGQTVGEGQFTTFSAEGSYNMKTGEQQSNISTFTGEVTTVLGKDSKEAEDLKFSFNAVGAYIEANLTEAGNNLKDFANLVTSYLQGATQSYFNQNNTSNTNITPVK
ncbi:hypothetical protein IRZ83_14110 [Flavobacterium sp. JLP]|uniref:DUF6443 domain-containing protein n=1 Tax=Flavobacterium sp. JLP TaxID=2783793 RepID=UPI00188C61BE|nr:DUF6443 domain-containing protein [Flavobacterium sp. JLP]MBF4507806.1 hypothetical protein [Flavobacterium sp. JLP]